jgi:primosomal protein N' (replication factor Y)
MAIARVEPLTTARALRGPFDYRLPPQMTQVGVGSVLVVPFGHRRVLGVVVDVVSESALPPDRLVEPLTALEAGAPPELVTLALWLSRDYCSTPARALALVLPPGTGAASETPGARTRLQMVARLEPAGREALAADARVRLTARQRDVLRALAGGPAATTELHTLHGIDLGGVKRLAARGLVGLERRPLVRRPAGVAVGVRADSEQRNGSESGQRNGSEQTRRGKFDLTPAQSTALERVVTALGDRRHERFLLHGVTGSGKTEVYLGAAAAALEQGRTAVVLVPEIALTPQTARRLRDRFGEQIAILHSQLGLGERYDEWQRLRRGEARVCVGPRSAVFAPLRDLGLVVIDEEHDSAYKQESDPRYDARRVAERRAEEGGAVLLSGSATPRPESWLRMERLDLPERVDGLHLPPVELVDMRDVHRPLHRLTREALDEVKRRRGKAIVLVSRRGWAPFLVCRSCGWTWTCPHCDVTLTLHRTSDGQRLHCHHCGHREQTPHLCPECRSSAIAQHGAGTQRLEAELASALAPLEVFRLDGDVGRRKHGIAHLLSRFADAPAGVLVGTQMVAQGHDFPEVELAVVVDADATLRFPDFRSEERTFSLVAQLAGRSGRGPAGGRVLVQTLCPEATCLQHAARHDAGAFLEEELQRRRALGYPPFSDLIRVMTAASDQKTADEAAQAVKRGMQGGGLAVLGPAQLFRVKDRYRTVLLIKTNDRDAAVARLGEAVQEVVAQTPRGTSFSLDVDPQ